MGHTAKDDGQTLLGMLMVMTMVMTIRMITGV